MEHDLKDMRPGLRLGIGLHHAACCSHRHRESEAPLEPICAGHSRDHAHRNELLRDLHPCVSAWVVSEAVWGVVASLSYNNFLLYSLCLQERMQTCLTTWVSLLSSWATCLTKLHKAYFSNRFFAPARTRSLGGTSSNIARSVSISAMLRHLLTMRNADAESLKLITMMMVNNEILAAL